MELLKIYLLLTLGIYTQAEPNVLKEYCELEMFEARCANDEVIMVKEAKYGRMHDGRCISKMLNHISMGCSVNALPYLDSLCSGRRQCEFKIVHLTSIIPEEVCPTYVRSYLEAKYSCVKVKHVEQGQCEHKPYIKVTDERGYLSSLIAEEDMGGSANCPWKVVSKPGQFLRVSLWDFSKTHPSLRSGKTCETYAVIKDPNAQISKKICATGMRSHRIFSSVSSVIDIQIVTNPNSQRYFLLKYETLGCPDIEPPQYGWMKREKDTIEWGCNNGDTVYALSCNGSEWSGTMGYCIADTAAPMVDAKPIDFKIWGMSFTGRGMFKALSAFFFSSIVLVVTAFVVLGIGIYYIWREKRKDTAFVDAVNGGQFLPYLPAGNDDGTASRPFSTGSDLEGTYAPGDISFFRYPQISLHEQSSSSSATSSRSNNAETQPEQPPATAPRKPARKNDIEQQYEKGLIGQMDTHHYEKPHARQKKRRAPSPPPIYDSPPPPFSYTMNPSNKHSEDEQPPLYAQVIRPKQTL